MAGSWLMIRKNGKPVKTQDFPWLLSGEELDNLERSLKPGESFRFQNAITREVRNMSKKAVSKSSSKRKSPARR